MHTYKYENPNEHFYFLKPIFASAVKTNLFSHSHDILQDKSLCQTK